MTFVILITLSSGIYEFGEFDTSLSCIEEKDYLQELMPDAFMQCKPTDETYETLKPLLKPLGEK